MQPADEMALMAIVRLIDAYDHYSFQHSQNVAGYSLGIAREMKLNPDECRIIWHAGLFHDIGKIGIPGSLLNKSRPLSREETELVREHSMLGYHIISKISGMKEEAEIILYHHERFDGRGYPHGLRGDNIPLGARILCVADSFDAMTSERAYSTVISVQDAIAELKRCAGTQFDPYIVNSFCSFINRTSLKMN